MGVAQLDRQKAAPKKASSATGPLECGALLAMKLAILAACSRVVPMTLGTAPKSDDAARVRPPVRGVEAGEGGDDVNVAIVRHRVGQGFDGGAVGDDF